MKKSLLLVLVVLYTSFISKAEKIDSIPLPLGLTEAGAIKLMNTCLRMVCYYEYIGDQFQKVIEIVIDRDGIEKMTFSSNLVKHKIRPIKSTNPKQKKELEVMSASIDGESIVFTIEVAGFSVKAEKTTIHQFPKLEAYMTQLLLETDEGIHAPKK